MPDALGAIPPARVLHDKGIAVRGVVLAVGLAPSRAASTASGARTTLRAIDVLLGLAMTPRSWRPAIASGFTSGTTSGISGTIRKALVLSMTTHPALAAMGANFSLVTINEKFTPRVLENVHRYGFTGRMTSWEPMGVTRLPNLAAELVRLKVDVIVTAGMPAASA